MMITILTALRAHKYLRLVIAIVLFGVLTGAVLGLSPRAKRSAKQPQSVAVSLTNMTSSVQVLDSHVVPLGGTSVLVAKLENLSAKNIKAITLSAGNKGVTQSFALGDYSLKPNSNTSISIPLSFGSVADENVAAKTFTVAAVLFADGTGDGDERHVKILCDEYAGMRAQANRVLRQLARLSSNTVQDSAFTDLENEARALPTNEGSVSQSYQDGLREARDWLLRQLDEIKEHKQSNRLDAADKKQEKVKRVFQSLAHGTVN